MFAIMRPPGLVKSVVCGEGGGGGGGGWWEVTAVSSPLLTVRLAASLSREGPVLQYLAAAVTNTSRDVFLKVVRILFRCFLFCAGTDLSLSMTRIKVSPHLLRDWQPECTEYFLCQINSEQFFISIYFQKLSQGRKFET